MCRFTFSAARLFTWAVFTAALLCRIKGDTDIESTGAVVPDTDAGDQASDAAAAIRGHWVEMDRTEDRQVLGCTSRNSFAICAVVQPRRLAFSAPCQRADLDRFRSCSSFESFHPVCESRARLGFVQRSVSLLQRPRLACGDWTPQETRRASLASRFHAEPRGHFVPLPFDSPIRVDTAVEVPRSFHTLFGFDRRGTETHAVAIFGSVAVKRG